MPRDGSGNFFLSESPFVFDTVISETAVNSNFSDIANALTASIAKDGQTVPTANLPMGGYKHTGVTTSSGSSSRSEYLAAATAQDGGIWDAGATAGTSTAYTATLTPAITAYADKQCFRVKVNAACGADPTINFNSVGAKKLYKVVAGSAVQLRANDLQAGDYPILRYDSSLDAATGGFVVLNDHAAIPPISRSSDTILAGADNGHVILATSTFTQTITAAATLGAGWSVGYQNAGSGVITLDPNGSETINGETSIQLGSGDGGWIVCDGSNFRFVGKRTIAFFAHRNGTNQSAIASATYTKINITNEDIDIGGYYDTTNLRWVPPAGTYRITGSLYWDAVNLVDQSQMIAAIYKNGSLHRGGIVLTSGTGSGLIASVTSIVEANGTDYFELYGYGGGAGAKQVNGTKDFTFFCGEQI